MSEFTVYGQFQARGGHQSFEKAVEAPSAEVARERVYAAFGSEHGLKRTQIDLEEVQE